MQKHLKNILSFFLFITVFSCGGGSGGEESTQNATFSIINSGEITERSIEITWEGNFPDALLLQVELCVQTSETCSEDNFSPAENSPLDPADTTYTESGLDPAKNYVFRIRGIGADGPSEWITGTAISTLLLAPSNLASTGVTEDTISLSWTNSTSTFESIEIERCEGMDCSDFQAVFDSPFEGKSDNSHTEKGLNSGTTYKFRIRVTTAEGNQSPWTESANITTTSSATADTSSPINFSLSSLTDTSVQFSWTNQASNNIVNAIERCSGQGCETFTTASGSPLSGSATTYSATDLSPNTFYRYRIKTTIADGTVLTLTGEEFRTAPAAPESLSTEVQGTDSIKVSWTDKSSDETEFEVERCQGTSCSSFSAISGSPLSANTTTVTDTGLSSSTSYLYRVRAVRGTSKSNWLTASSAAMTKVAAASCSTLNTNIIDRGDKGTVAATGRGLFSDTKVIPGTRRPAVAYYDGSTTGGKASVKVSWWDGSAFQVESVAGDSRVTTGSATWVRLAFLSSGIPLVFWTTGSTTVKAAVRSAAFGNDGTWSGSVIDTVAGAANRALEVSVSPSNQVGLIYLTNTTTAGRARFIYCESSCNTLSNYVAMTSSSDTIEASNVITAFNDTGIAWCKHDSSTYYPAVTYPGNSAADIRYASCLGSLSTCKTAAGWSSQYLSIVSTAGKITKLYIDSSTVGDKPKVLSRNSGNSLLQAFEVDQACNTTPSSVTSGNTFGISTSGSAWADLLKDEDGIFHVVSNQSNQRVYYHNSDTTTFSTTTWNSPGTIERINVPNAGSGAGGADINNTDGQLYTSYASRTAPYTLKLGVVADIKTASNSSSASYYSLIPDSSGGIHLETSTAQTRNVSTAVTSDGKFGVAYVDNSKGSVATAVLKYAFRDGTSSSTPWDVVTIPNVSAPKFPSLAYDHNNKPWISYYDAGSGFFRYYLATNSSTDGSGTWSTFQFPIRDKTGNGSTPSTDDTTVAMFYENNEAKPVMIVINSTTGGGVGVKAAMLDTSTSSFVGFTTIETLSSPYATRLASDFDKNGNIVIAYFDRADDKVNFNYSSTGTSWLSSSPSISSASTGQQGLAIKINPADSKPAVSYYDMANNTVYYTSCDSAASSCFSSSSWSTTTVNSSLGISGIATANEQILNTSLTYSNIGTAYVSYMQGIGASTQSLIQVNNSSGSFTNTTTLSSSPTANLSGASAMNFAMTGFSESSARSNTGDFLSAFVGPNNWLYAITCGD